MKREYYKRGEKYTYMRDYRLFKTKPKRKFSKTRQREREGGGKSRKVK
jgi:hypothetical protein